MHKKITFLFILLIAIIGLAGCGTVGDEKEKATGDEQESTSSETITVEHELDETEVPKNPKKIVALEFSYVDALAALGISPVGIADDNDPSRIIKPIQEKIGDYTSVGTRKQPSLEIISSLKPDLIIADLQRHKDIYEQLSDIAPTIVLNSLAADYDQILADFEKISVAVGKEEEGKEILTQHKQRIEEIKTQVPENEDRIVLPGVVTPDGFFAHNMDSYTGSLLESIGLKNAIQDGSDRYNKINLEQVVEFNPDVLFLMQAGDKTIIDEWAKSPLWKDVSAVKNDNLYTVDRNTWSRFRGLISSEAILEEAVSQLYGD
ncbi:Fe(3+) dicitrate ABC transporter substrate-binding protein [Aquibacillus sp. 3ASR75-11]|uniref:Fe(3+) dicitrate ABC transporter substrate-binding protein n=1 Tax=Terrihalobacillus insolitus TaxID=2950438 RepID=A0A9X4AMD2_9BACI|nr:Fe(3+) dicitrate ABC transporter substrate-binding protein [Terrihalobacillus insolitus]MDC3411944.1 Fe(3+) dicitrate ABC transporter substrate-binding protein [Terrihalobacillus insolitus]MDC3423370.1 Fe(3+) dicitrate ABC transporter substrate-binding protein [Terrihalobacillus insolitus]